MAATPVIVVGSQVARGNIAISGVLNRINYYAIFIVHT
jgi:hypothetical protein